LKPSYAKANTFLSCRKIPKTLSGIETVRDAGLEVQANGAGKYLKPYQGLKRCRKRARKETQRRRKIPKTLSGIETTHPPLADRYFPAGKYLKPYQGLKRRF